VVIELPTTVVPITSRLELQGLHRYYTNVVAAGINEYAVPDLVFWIYN
jgi:hypothetical protein